MVFELFLLQILVLYPSRIHFFLLFFAFYLSFCLANLPSLFFLFICIIFICESCSVKHTWFLKAIFHDYRQLREIYGKLYGCLYGSRCITSISISNALCSIIRWRLSFLCFLLLSAFRSYDLLDLWMCNLGYGCLHLSFNQCGLLNDMEITDTNGYHSTKSRIPKKQRLQRENIYVPIQLLHLNSIHRYISFIPLFFSFLLIDYLKVIRQH